MTAKEYLSQIRKAEIMIRIRAQELQKLKLHGLIKKHQLLLELKTIKHMKMQ